MKRVVVISSASGSGKTTVGRALADRLGVPFHELDAIHWQAGWTELDAAEFRRRVEPLVEGDSWVVDGSYRSKLGDLVLEAADTVVWLDLPRRVWLSRLVWRTVLRVVRRDELWNGNRESFRTARRPGLALRLRAAQPVASAAALPLGARAVPGRATQDAGRGGRLPARGLAVTLSAQSRFPFVTIRAIACGQGTGGAPGGGCSLGPRRDRSSATQAAARRPSQIGVSTT